MAILLRVMEFHCRKQFSIISRCEAPWRRVGEARIVILLNPKPKHSSGKAMLFSASYIACNEYRKLRRTIIDVFACNSACSTSAAPLLFALAFLCKQLWRSSPHTLLHTLAAVHIRVGLAWILTGHMSKPLVLPMKHTGGEG